MARRETGVEERTQRVLAYLKSRIEISAALLFGSHVEARARPGSDIDVAVFSPDEEKMTLERRIRLIADVKLNCDRDIEIHLFPASALEEGRRSSFIGHILATGRRVSMG